MTLIKILAVDLGASSGRVMQAIYDGERLQLSEVHRFKNEAVTLILIKMGICCISRIVIVTTGWDAMRMNSIK